MYLDIHIHIHLGLRVCEVAHDHQVQVSRYVTDELGFLNSYDTWHGEAMCMHVQSDFISLLTCIPGTKNVAKELKKIAQGANKWEGVNWFRELSDKRKCMNLHVCGVYGHVHVYTCECEPCAGRSTKVHLYWAMKNCNGSPENLRQKILNTSSHYEVYTHYMYTYNV